MAVQELAVVAVPVAIVLLYSANQAAAVRLPNPNMAFGQSGLTLSRLVVAVLVAVV